RLASISATFSPSLTPPKAPAPHAPTCSSRFPNCASATVGIDPEERVNVSTATRGRRPGKLMFMRSRLEGHTLDAISGVRTRSQRGSVLSLTEADQIAQFEQPVN